MKMEKGMRKNFFFDEIATLSKEKINPKNSDELKCIELENIDSEVAQINGWVSSREQKSTKNIFRKGNVLFGKLRPYLKKYWFATFDGVCSSEIWVLQANAETITEKYLFYFIQSDEFISVANVSAGSKMPRADWDFIVHYPFSIRIPSLPEQKKIADFLSSVDSRIQMLTEKKELLEQYKKGMMQKLFSQEIRFKDDNGNDYPDWKEKKLGEVLRFVNSNSYSRNQLNYDKGTVRNVHYGDIHTKYNSLLKVKEEKIPYINPNIDTTKMTDEQYVIEGDLIIADASEDYEDVGKCVEIIDLQDYKLVAGLHTFIARDIDDFALGFKTLLMRSQFVRKQIMRMAQGISVLGISKSNLSKIILYIPSLPEQQKIADFLSAIDRKIELVNSQIELSKEYKKGLLQRMMV